MGAIFEAITSFFREDNWPYLQIEDKPVLSLSYAGKNARFACFARADEEREIFLFYCFCPVKAPEDKRLILADFLTRANYGLLIGNFEMDFDDGEVRYKTSIDVEGDRLSSALIRRLVYANVGILDKYLPGIMSIIYGGASPTEAIVQVER